MGTTSTERGGWCSNSPLRQGRNPIPLEKPWWSCLFSPRVPVKTSSCLVSALARKKYLESFESQMWGLFLTVRDEEICLSSFIQLKVNQHIQIEIRKIDWPHRRKTKIPVQNNISFWLTILHSDNQLDTYEIRQCKTRLQMTNLPLTSWILIHQLSSCHHFMLHSPRKKKTMWQIANQQVLNWNIALWFRLIAFDSQFQYDQNAIRRYQGE